MSAYLVLSLRRVTGVLDAMSGANRRATRELSAMSRAQSYARERLSIFTISKLAGLAPTT